MMGFIFGVIAVLTVTVCAGYYLGHSTGAHDGYELGYRDGSLGYPRKMGKV